MDIVIGSFLFYVSFMQLIEYLLWKHQKCDNYNKIVSIIGMILNHMQPIILGIIIILIAKPKIENIYIIISVMCIYFLCAILYSIEFLRNNGQCTIKNRKTKHLEWKWNEEEFNWIFYLLFLLSFVLLFIYGMPTFTQGIIFAFLSVFLFVTTIFIYYPEHIGSMLCFYSAFVPIIYYIIRRTIVKNINF